jgi:hypothetical protein
MDSIRRRILQSLSALAWFGPELVRSATECLATGYATREMALDAVRLLNTLELTHKLKQGRYASKADLFISETVWRFQGWLEKNRNKIGARHLKVYETIDFESDQTLPGWTLAIHRSELRDAYLLALVSAVREEEGARRVFASDESGVIYEGSLASLVIPARYSRLRDVFPDLMPIQVWDTKLLLSRVRGFVRRVAYAGMYESAGAMQGSCTCCSSGNCSESGQCYCVNCGTSPVCLVLFWLLQSMLVELRWAILRMLLLARVRS